MINTNSNNSREIIVKLYDYMMEQGILFNKINLSDSSPYAIMSGGSSIGYRGNANRNKWGKSGIVFFCTKLDANNLASKLSVFIDDNSSDSARPYAIFIPNDQVEAAVKVLKDNPLNVLERKDSVMAGNKNSYQRKYWETFFPYVKRCLARDGYSDSESNTRTTVTDTFYLERQDSRDFMSWFRDEQSFEAAKRRIVELLTAANRKNSNLNTDIKYYTRDIGYFAEFIGLHASNTPREDMLKYRFVRHLAGKQNVSLVKSSENAKLYVQKEYDNYNADVFNRIKEADIVGVPRIIDIEVKGNKLITVEEYIDGTTLDEIVQKGRFFNESEILFIGTEIAKILKQMHELNPPILHRDIKPANIIYSKTNKLYLIDFNASKEIHKNTSEDTVFAGTSGFAAPEQTGPYAQSSVATDVYGLGATLSYLMTGTFSNRIVAIGRFQDVFKKCVKMDPEDRYQSIEEFVEALLRA